MDQSRGETKPALHVAREREVGECGGVRAVEVSRARDAKKASKKWLGSTPANLCIAAS